MSDFEELILGELERILPLPDGGRADWADVLRRAGGKSRRSRPLLAAALAAAALAGAGVAIAAGFGAFNGISATQGPQTPAALQWAKHLQSTCEEVPASQQAYYPTCNLVLASARVLGTAPDGTDVYAATDTRGDLCVSFALGAGCGPPLDASHPITAGSANPSPDGADGGEFTAGGVALDSVTSVSFTVGGREVTVPVKNNVWIYQEPNSHATGFSCIQAHLADGSTVDPFPEIPCPASGSS